MNCRRRFVAALLAGVWWFGWTAHGDAPSWHNEKGFRWRALEVPLQGKTGFTIMPPAVTGIQFTNTLGESSIATNRVLANGSGVAVGDYDGDGLPDIFLCGLETPSVLYHNLGHFKFEDITAEAGLPTDQKNCRGAVLADINGDGWLDLLISTVNEGVRCFVNDGHGRFADATGAAGTRSSFGSTTLALADIDGNGTLDLYVANYRTDDIRDHGRVSLPVIRGRPVIPVREKNHLLIRNGQVLEYGQPDQLYLNDGRGHFRAVSWTDGTFLDEFGQKLAEPPLDWGLSATFRDVNGDLAPDLYVCNDYWTPDRFWINDGHGHFRAIPKLALRETSSSSMGIDFADLDRDGHLDFFVVDMLSRDARLRKRQMLADKPEASMIGAISDRPQIMRNTLFRNRGDGTYEELANYADLVGSDWSWSPVFLDVDLDGYEDLLISAGHFHDVQDLDAEREIRARQHSWHGYSEADRQKAYTRELTEHYRLYPPLDMPIRSFRNCGAWRFQETTMPWGLNQLAIHHGMALGDFDGDGALDLVVNNLNSSAAVYRNESPAGRVAVRLKGLPPNTEGIGSKIILLNGAIPSQSSEIICGGRYLSGSEAVAVFATGAQTDGMTVEVRWRSGRKSTIPNVRTNRLYEIDEAAAAAPAPDPRPAQAHLPPPWFKDVSAAISLTHHQPDYNDFERQPLLPFKLSQPGPGVAWLDLDGDGHEDLIVGAARGQNPALFHGDGRGGFSRIELRAIAPMPNDLAGLVGGTDTNGRPFLLAGVSGYETASTNGAVQFAIQGTALASSQPVALDMTTGSAIALGDLDGNGQLTLFVAGGVAPGRYPLGAPSKIYRQHGTYWELDSRNSLLLDNIGIVNGAVWSDLNGDGIPELILACEWGPIRVFQKRSGALFDLTDELGLSQFKGWWKGVTVGDFDGDGRLDIVASNWGLNSPYHASPEHPLLFVYGELFRPGAMDLIETECDPVTGQNLPRRQWLTLANSLPFLLDIFPTHKAYSEASLEQVLSDRALLAHRVEVTTLASCVFLNRGRHFEAMPLPMEAQLAPAFSVNVADFDGDGHEDIFLSQNFFATQPELPRLDAGRGLLLRGDGTGRFTPMDGARSGIEVYGEQRGAAIADFNEDGRPDLVVTQNGAAIRLFQNTSAIPGLRVRLKGPSGNPYGISSALRLQFGSRFGPLREVHAGSGYWSQDSFTQVLAMPTQPSGIWIRWPGGRVTITPLPRAFREVTIDAAGRLVSTTE